MGKLKIAVNPGGSHNTLDSFYSELAEEYPGLLPEEADEYHQIYSIICGVGRYSAGAFSCVHPY